MAKTVSKWGPAAGIDSRDYLFAMQGQYGPTDELQPLDGHALTSPNQTLTDPLVLTETELRNGRIVAVTKVKRAAEETGRTYTVGFPSAIWTPAQQRAMRGNCPTTLFLRYLCPPDPIYAHWITMPDATMNPPIDSTDPVTNADETVFLTKTSEIQVQEYVQGYAIGFDVVYDLAGSEGLNDIRFIQNDCPGCSDAPGYELHVAGDAPTGAIPTSLLTEDRFTSVDVLTTGAAIDTDITATFVRGDLFIDAISAKLYVSSNRGATYREVDTAAAVVIKAFAECQGLIFAAGQNATDAKLYVSANNGVSFTEVTNFTWPATSPLRDISADIKRSRIYMVGGTGKLIVGKVSNGAVNLTDISANLPGTPGALHSVVVLAENHFIVGGASGYLAESTDGGLTFRVISFPGTGTISFMDGNIHRLVLASTTKLYVRTPLTDNAIVELPLENGVTLASNITRVRMMPGDMNMFAFTTADGKVGIGKPFYPGA